MHILGICLLCFGEELMKCWCWCRDVLVIFRNDVEMFLISACVFDKLTIMIVYVRIQSTTLAIASLRPACYA